MFWHGGWLNDRPLVIGSYRFHIRQAYLFKLYERAAHNNEKKAT